MAAAYRRRMRDKAIRLDAVIQKQLIDELQTACQRQAVSLHAVATDKSHLHVLLSWRDERSWQQVRTSLRRSLSARLNLEGGKRQWFSRGGSRKRIEEQSHFDHLVNAYLPKHRGWKWTPQTGLFR